MAAEKQTQGSRHFGRFRDRTPHGPGSAATTSARFVRVGQPANDNRIPSSLLILRTAMLAALVGLMVTALL
jgi:hypothetical protein